MVMVFAQGDTVIPNEIRNDGANPSQVEPVLIRERRGRTRWVNDQSKSVGPVSANNIPEAFRRFREDPVVHHCQPFMWV